MAFPLTRWWAKARRAPPSRAPLALLTGWAGASLPRGHDTLARETYVRNAIAQRAVKLVAEGAASARWLAGGTDRVGVVDTGGHPLLALLARPNPRQSGPDLVEALASHLLLAGNAYVEVVTDDDDRPVELHLLRPERVSIVAGATGWPADYRYQAGGQVARYPVDPVSGRAELLHLRAFHPLDDHYGLSPLEAVAAETHNAAARWNKALLDNAARPSGALVFDPGEAGAALSADQFERLKREMEEGFAGAVNAGRPMLLEGGLKWQPLSLSPADMDFVAARDAAAREIALAFGVPPMLLGLPGDNTYANYQEANRALWRLTILPLLAKLTAGVAAHFSAWWPDLTLDIDRDAVPALSADRERLWAQVSAADFLTAVDKRRLLGLEVSENVTEQ